MKDKPEGDRFCESERQHIDGDTQRCSHVSERNLSRSREHFGKRSDGRHDRHLVNWQTVRDDCVTATLSPTGEFGQFESHCRTRPRDARRDGQIAPCDVPRIAELQQELESMRTVLQGSVRNLEVSRELQKAISDEALSANEGHQSMKKELLASRSEVQSLKQELTALKSQMLETMKPHFTASEDPENTRQCPAATQLFLPMSNGDPRAISECHPGAAWNSAAFIAWRQTAANHIAGLTQRQREVMELVLASRPSKNIAAHLGISQRTVENHRASIMKKTGSKSLPALTRLALFAAGSGTAGLLLLGGLPVTVLQPRVHS